MKKSNMLNRHFIISSSSNEVHNIPNNEIHFIPFNEDADDIIDYLSSNDKLFNANIVNIEFSDLLERYIITFDNTITELYTLAFDNLNITSIFLPNSITAINIYALTCYYLESIVYDGTMEEWNNIQKYDFWYGNSKPIIHCTDGTIEL